MAVNTTQAYFIRIVGSRYTERIQIVLLVLVLLFAAYLRLVNLTDNPGWYTDEGSNLDVAQHLAAGESRYMALGQSTLLVSRLVLFENILAGLLRLFGGGISTLRALSGSLGVLSVGVLYFVVRRTTTRAPGFALLAAFVLAIFPQAVLYSRFGFSYNLLTPLVLLAYWGFWEYLTTGHRIGLVFAALSIGVGTLSDLWMLSFVLPLFYIVAVRRWRDLVWSLPLVIAPFAGYCTVMWITAPAAFLFDLQFVLFRVGGISIPTQLQNIALNYTTLIAQDGWMCLGVLGILFMRPFRLWYLTLVCFGLPLLFLGRTLALYDLSFYYMIPVLPFVALGFTAMLYYGVPALWQRTNPSNRNSLGDARWQRAIQYASRVGLLCFIVGLPLAVSLSGTLHNVQHGFQTAIDRVLIKGSDARDVAQYINTHVEPNDVVLASPTVAWLFHARTADFQMAISATGQPTPHFPAGLASSRFLFDPRLEHARYVVVDDLWRHWAVFDVPGVAAMLQQVEAWPRVFQAGTLYVYARVE